MYIRKGTLQDRDQLRQLFYDTVTQVNSRDYNPEQIKAWSSGRDNIAGWTSRLESQHFAVAEEAGQILGFSSIDPQGYLDLMFVHHAHQGRGIATLLIQDILATAQAWGLGRVHSDVSITARPFFERQGFVVVTPQQIMSQGVELTNFKMEKHLV